MIIFTIEDIEIRKNHDTVGTIPKNMSFTVVSLEYIPRDTEILSPGDTYIVQQESQSIEKHLRDDFFIIFFRKLWFALPKELCEIPKFNGWRPNL